MSHILSSVTESQQDEFNDATSMFVTTITGKVFEYQIPKHAGTKYELTKIFIIFVTHKF